MKSLYKIHHVYTTWGTIYICIEFKDEYWFAYANKEMVVKSHINRPITKLLLNDPVMVIRTNVNHKTNEVKHDIYMYDRDNNVKVGYIITKSGHDNCIHIGHGTNKDDSDKDMDRFLRRIISNKKE